MLGSFTVMIMATITFMITSTITFMVTPTTYTKIFTAILTMIYTTTPIMTLAMDYHLHHCLICQDQARSRLRPALHQILSLQGLCHQPYIRVAV